MKRANNNSNINYKKDVRPTVVVRQILSNQFGSGKVYGIYVKIKLKAGASVKTLALILSCTKKMKNRKLTCCMTNDGCCKANVCVCVGQQANPSIKCQSFDCNVHSSSIEIYCALLVNAFDSCPAP